MLNHDRRKEADRKRGGFDQSQEVLSLSSLQQDAAIREFITQKYQTPQGQKPSWVGDERAVNFVIAQVKQSLDGLNPSPSDTIHRSDLEAMIWTSARFGTCCNLGKNGAHFGELSCEWPTDDRVIETAIRIALADGDTPYPDDRQSLMATHKRSGHNMIGTARNVAQSNMWGFDVFIDNVLLFATAFEFRYPNNPIKLLKPWINALKWFAHLDQAEAVKEHIRSYPTNERVKIWIPGCYHGEDLFALAAYLRKDNSINEGRIEYHGTDLLLPEPGNKIMPVQRSRLDEVLGRDLSTECFNNISAHFCVPNDSWAGRTRFSEQNLTEGCQAGSDIIICNAVLPTLNEDLKIKALSNILQAIKPGGVILFENETYADRCMCSAAHQAIISWAETNRLVCTDLSEENNTTARGHHSYRLKVTVPAS
ncbi:MAG: hypothetical protein RIS36_2264 [Pseudomonadota bacterium]|jgi:hypothetical protein